MSFPGNHLPNPLPARNKTPIYVLAFLANMGYGIIIPSLALYAESLGSSYSLVGIIVSVYAGAQLVTQVPAGHLSDRTGRKLLVVAGFAGVVVAAILYNFANNPYYVLALQALAGLSIGCIWPPLMAQLTEQTRPVERGKVMGIFNTAYFSGVGLGPLVGGYVSSNFGNLASFNLWAVVSGMGGLFAILYFKEMPGPVTTVDPQARAGTRAGKLVKEGTFTSFMAACVVRSRGGFCTGFNNAILPLYVSSLFLNIPETKIGGLMFIHGMMLAVFNFPGGMASDRFGRKWPSLYGSLVATAGVLWYSLPSGYWALFAAVGLAGAGAATTNAGMAALVGDISSPSRRGEAFGFFLTSFFVGMVLGSLLFGLVADLAGLRASVLMWGIFSLGLSLSGLLIKSRIAQPPVSPPE